MNGVRQCSPEFLQALRLKLEGDTERIQSAQVIARAIIDGRKMGKLSAVAQRISDTRRKLDDEADRLANRLDGLDKKAPEAFAVAHSVVDSQHADLDGMEAELRQLSNLGPLASDS